METQKINIHFASHIAARQSWNENPSPGTVYLNTPGLLTELEKRLGLGGQFPPHRDRLALFQQLLEKYAEQAPKAFFAESLKKDPVAVAEQLLEWRDELVFSGWNASINYDSPRLQNLAEIESTFNTGGFLHYGEADRWKDVEAKLKQIDLHKLGIGHIFLYDNPALLHPCIQSILQRLQPLLTEVPSAAAAMDEDSNLYKIQQGLATGNFEGKLNLSDHSFRILRFTDNLMAAEFLAANLEQGWKPILVGNDRSLLDDCLSSRSCPATGSTLESANTAIIQLFKLLPVAHIAPLNIHNLMAFLQSPFSPLNGLLRYRLSKVLAEKPGVLNKEWLAGIEDFKKNEADKLIEKLKAGGAKEEFIQSSIADLHSEHNIKIKHYLKFRDPAATTVVLQDIADMLADARKWIMSRISFEMKEEERKQFLWLGEMCAALALRMKQKLDEGSTEMKSDDFLKLIHSIYEPADFINFQRQIQSAHAVNHAGGAVHPTGVFVWTDFYNGISSGGQRFLSEAEEQEATSKGARIYAVRNRIQLGFEACKRSILLSQRQCILIFCETHNGEPTSEHPLFARLKAAYPNADKLITDYSPGKDVSDILNIQCLTEPIENVALPLPPEEFLRIEPNLIQRRQKESASSLEKLIEFPFDWTVQYAAEFRSAGAFSIPDMLLLKGNISHAAMEEILSPAPAAAQKLSEAEIGQILDRKILEGGAVLLLPENRFECEAFRRQFIISAVSLLQIIQLNELKVEGCERPLPPDFEIEEIGKVSGFMDLLLSKKDGTQVVFDLKWAYNVSKYEKKIADGASIQLAIYARAMGAQTQTAYFIMSSNTLISRHRFEPGGADFLQTGEENYYSEANTMEKTKKSYSYRMQKLQQGEIEMGEGEKLEELDYGMEMNTEDMIPIADKDGKKKKNRYSGLELFKGGIA